MIEDLTIRPKSKIVCDTKKIKRPQSMTGVYRKGNHLTKVNGSYNTNFNANSSV